MDTLLSLALEPFAPAAGAPPRAADPGFPHDLPAWAGTVAIAVAADRANPPDALTRAIQAARLDLAGTHAGARVWTSAAGDLALMAAGGALEFPVGDATRNLACLSLGPWGTLDVAVPLIARQITLVALSLAPGGAFELAMAGLPPPSGTDRAAAAARLAIIATLLGHDGGRPPTSPFLAAIRSGRRVDPVITPLLWATMAVDPQGAGLREAAARRLVSRFPALIDGHVMLAVEAGRRFGAMLAEATYAPRPAFTPAEEIYRQAVRRRTAESVADEPSAAMRTQPITAAALHRLADFALAAGLPDHWAVDRRRRLRPGAVWNAVWTPPAN